MLALLDRLGQARVRHAIEYVTDALGMIGAQDVDNLVIQLIDLISGPARSLYGPRLISGRHDQRPAFAASTIGNPLAWLSSFADIAASG